MAKHKLVLLFFLWIQSESGKACAGECEEAQAIVDDLGNLEVARAQLHEDRESLEPCTCTEVDAKIADVNTLAGELLGIIADFDEQG